MYDVKNADATVAAAFVPANSSTARHSPGTRAASLNLRHILSHALLCTFFFCFCAVPVGTSFVLALALAA